MDRSSDLLEAVEEMLAGKFSVYVLERDRSDGTYLVAWTDGLGKARRVWLTDEAMKDLTTTWVLN